jgi:exopolyphosphatase / guanosine-5'-triphosphate,3'-diphosphate pyrophosphatase
LASSASHDHARRYAAAGEGPIGVVDIGSNSVRLVIYDRLVRSPLALFNEKSLCAIGRNMVRTGVLDEDGSVAAIAALGRFREIARSVRVQRLEAFATAAVRDARNGAEFVARAREAIGTPIRILSGEDEARFAAEGVLAAIPDADGVVGDLGGGSLELAFVSQGQHSGGLTLPFGPLRLMDMSEGRPERARAIVDAELERLPGIERLRGKALYAVGGVWRNIARMHLDNVQHPVRVLHHYEIPRDRAIDFSNFIAGLSRKSLETSAGVTRKRAETIPYGAVVMERLLKVGRLDRVVISAFGVREGLLFSRLAPEERAKDPLLAACEDMSRRLGRDTALGAVLDRWTSPLFSPTDKAFEKLRRAACHLADTGWRGHPDHRAELIYAEVLNAPFIGIDHHRRNLLALSLFHRYGGEDDRLEKRAARFIGEDAVQQAKRLGFALRAALVLAGPAPAVLQETSIKLTPTTLVLTIPRSHQALIAEAMTKRLDALAAAFGKVARVELR